MRKIGCVLVLACLLAVGCSDAERAAFNARGKKHKVTLWGCQGPLKEWTSTGMIHNEANSDGYYFEDSATGKMIAVSGVLTIEVLD